MRRPLSTVGGRIPGTVGWDEAAELVREILVDGAPVHAGITGTGGAGKTTLLDALAEALRDVGADVFRSLDEADPAGSDGAPVALLIDDAEHLSDEDVDRLTRLMRSDGPHVIVAFRPWPRSEAVAELVDRLGRQRPHLVLRHLAASAVRDRAADLLEDPPTDEQVDRVLELTQGTPWFVDQVLLAVGEGDWSLREADPIPSTTL